VDLSAILWRCALKLTRALLPAFIFAAIIVVVATMIMQHARKQRAVRIAARDK